MNRAELTHEGVTQAIAWIRQTEQSAPTSRRASLLGCLQQLTDLKECLERGETPPEGTAADVLSVLALVAHLERSSLATPAASALRERTGAESLRRIAQYRSALEAEDEGKADPPEAGPDVHPARAMTRLHSRLRAYLERLRETSAKAPQGGYPKAQPDRDWSVRTEGESDGTEAVVCTTLMRLVISEASFLPVPAEFRYRPSDPYAVKATFHTGAEELVEWIIARETIAAGLRIRAGAGDVQVWPSQTSGPDAVCLALTSPEGTALLEAPQAALQTFLRRTNDLVSPGTEGQHVDIDKALDHAFRHSNDPRPTSKARKPTK